MKNILWLTDNVTQIQPHAKALKYAGYTCVVCRTCIDAEEKISSGAYDLVLINDYVPVGGPDEHYVEGSPAGEQFYKMHKTMIPRVTFLTFNPAEGKVDMMSISDTRDFLEFIERELEHAVIECN